MQHAEAVNEIEGARPERRMIDVGLHEMRVQVRAVVVGRDLYRLTKIHGDDFARAGLVNLVGGCCGTTPAHIQAIADAVRDVEPRALPSPASLKAA